jgi:hypothetical protein
MSDARYQVSLIICEEPDQARCARTLAQHHPQATQAELIGIINECEPQLRSMGFGNLSVLRKELERVHPAWGRKP